MEYGSVSGKDDAISIDLREILGVLYKNRLRIIAMTLIMAFIGFLYGVNSYKPVYTANALLIVNSKQLSIVGQEKVVINDVTMSKELVSTYSVILKSNHMLNLVNDELDVKIPLDTLKNSIIVTTENDTEVLRIEVQNEDPELAAKIANSLMKVAPEVISETVEVGTIKVVDYANVPKSPSQPKTKLYTALGGFFGLFVAFGCAVLFYLLDNTVKKDKDIVEELNLTLLGSVPYYQPKSRRKKKKQEAPVLTNRHLDKLYIEAYKSIRTNLLISAKVHSAKLILVTSSLAKEGKSTVSINLAMSLSQMEKRVLLINCDLRNPSICRKLSLDVENKCGLSDILIGNCIVEDCIVHLPDTKVDLLPSPIPSDNASDILGMEAMGKLLDCLKEKYQYIIMDTPPMHLVTDAGILAEFADGIIYVVKQHHTNKHMLKSDLNSLMRINPNLLGCIHNCVDFAKSDECYQKNGKEKFGKTYLM